MIHKTVASENSGDSAEPAHYSGTPLPIVGDGDSGVRPYNPPLSLFCLPSFGEGIPLVRNVTSGPHPEGDAYLGHPRPRTSEDILNEIHPRGDTNYNLNVFCNELRQSPEAEHARVISILRYATGKRVMHRFLILHAVKKSGQNFFIRCDRRPRSRNLIKLTFGGYLAANDHVGLWVVAIPDGILTAFMLYPGKVGALEYAPIIRVKTRKRSRHQF